jgi:hypothetical protein
MQANSIAAQATSSATALLVAVALLFAQWIGVQHKIFHAPLSQAYLQASSVADTDGIGDKDVQHSCASFDAATVGESIHILPFVAPLVTSAQVLALWAAFISWDAPVTSYFSSRAPPLA